MAKLADANSGRDRAVAAVDTAVAREDGGAASPDPVEEGLREAVTGANGAQRARILLVEDEPGIVDFVRRGFEADGFAVEAALDGVEGERLALRGRLRRDRARPDAAGARRARGARLGARAPSRSCP